MVAEPKPQGAGPFTPLVTSGIRLPVALDGFCIVTLREHQEWLLGSEANQVVFDGQLYWFASQRERAMFAASPQRYVPALGGNCVVTFAESGVRKRGNPSSGILHNQRLYFFKGIREQQEFQANPDRYSTTDLANDGLCLVSQTDDQQRLPGVPETTVIVDGLTYRFAGVHQQQNFLVNMRRYGVEPPSTLQQVASNADRSKVPPPVSKNIGSVSSTKLTKPKRREKKSISDLKNKAMSGYCPVSIRDAGVWTVGEPSFHVEFDGLTYLMAGEVEHERFLERPHDYIPALGCCCVVTEIDENRRVQGSIYHASQFEGRLYLFAGAEQKQAFDTTAPEKYANADLVANGNCIVSLIDNGETIDGVPELLTWHKGKRYLFATPAQQAKFRENATRYLAQ